MTKFARSTSRKASATRGLMMWFVAALRLVELAEFLNVNHLLVFVQAVLVSQIAYVSILYAPFVLELEMRTNDTANHNNFTFPVFVYR